MPYIENPKTKGSGIYAAIPQTGLCPNKCPECFYQNGRSYLEPLEKNLPNIPQENFLVGTDRIVRVNDGHDSYFLFPSELDLIIRTAHGRLFFNTSIPIHLDKYCEKDNPKHLYPVVLTVNPGDFTDRDFHQLDPIPPNLMFVRVRVTMWNLKLVDDVINYYDAKEVPIVLTFMAYADQQAIPEGQRLHYTYRTRTLNPYWAITTQAYLDVMDYYRLNKWVYSCGKIEGAQGDTHCRFCGNCVREYHNTMERLEMLKP